MAPLPRTRSHLHPRLNLILTHRILLALVGSRKSRGSPLTRRKLLNQIPIALRLGRSTTMTNPDATAVDAGGPYAIVFGALHAPLPAPTTSTRWTMNAWTTTTTMTIRDDFADPVAMTTTWLMNTTTTSTSLPCAGAARNAAMPRTTMKTTARAIVTCETKGPAPVRECFENHACVTTWNCPAQSARTTAPLPLRCLVGRPATALRTCGQSRRHRSRLSSRSRLCRRSSHCSRSSRYSRKFHPRNQSSRHRIPCRTLPSNIKCPRPCHR
mmetsp:Transcript_53266/g.130535  ORF Transcript_53266/g.130535 Transcript_53266/m.130535 type:complete len:269 (-) Transcript_53266:350-1156(-)